MTEQTYFPHVLGAIERASTFSPFRSVHVERIDCRNFRSSTVDDIFSHPELARDIAAVDGAIVQHLRSSLERHLLAVSWWTFSEDATPPNVPPWWINPSAPPVLVRGQIRTVVVVI